MATLTLDGYAELIAKIERLSDLRTITGGLKAGAAILQGDLQDYPEQRTGRPQPFKTERQRRYFFWALKRGIIEVPYKRGRSPGSVNLKQRWRIRTENALRVVLENDAQYAGIVHGAQSQARFHAAGGWPTDQRVLDKNRDTIVRIVNGRILGVLAGRAATD